MFLIPRISRNNQHASKNGCLWKNAAELPRKNPKVYFGFAKKLMVKQCCGFSHGRFLYHVCWQETLLLMTSVPTPIFLRKPFSCKACPGIQTKESFPLKTRIYYGLVGSGRTAGRPGGAGQDQMSTGQYAQEPSVTLTHVNRLWEQDNKWTNNLYFTVRIRFVNGKSSIQRWRC